MNYWSGGGNPRDLFVFLRNKNLDLFPRHAGLGGRTVERTVGAIVRFRRWLLARRGFSLVVSEQVVENTLALQHLRPQDRAILDFGGYESLLPLQLAAVGRRVTVWDQRPYPFSHPNLAVVCRDLFSTEADEAGPFDAILSISTLEHMGLGHYGDEAVADGDARAMEILWGMLRSGGRLLASVPVGGAYSVQRGYRIYDEERLRRTFPRASSILWYAKEGREGTWGETTAARVRTVSYSEPRASMPVEAIAFVVCDKEAQAKPGAPRPRMGL